MLDHDARQTKQAHVIEKYDYIVQISLNEDQTSFMYTPHKSLVGCQEEPNAIYFGTINN